MKLAMLTGLCLVLWAAPLGAQERSSGNTVVLAPVSSLGGSSSRALAALEKTIEAGLGTVPDMQVISARSAARSTRKARRPELRLCEGDPECLSHLGVLASAQLVVYAEVGGLGDAQVVYLKLIETSSKKELRSTTLQLSSRTDAQQASRRAAIRLLAPNLYVGTLELSSTVDGAIVYLDGHKVATTPSEPISVFVGSHALRVTHPEHRDYVRFVDIEFRKQTSLVADLHPLPGVKQRLAREGLIEDPNSGPTLVHLRETPWYYRWYSVAGGATVLAIGSALIIGSTTGGINADAIRDL